MFFNDRVTRERSPAPITSTQNRGTCYAPATVHRIAILATASLFLLAPDAHGIECLCRDISVAELQLMTRIELADAYCEKRYYFGMKKRTFDMAAQANDDCLREVSKLKVSPKTICNRTLMDEQLACMNQCLDLMHRIRRVVRATYNVPEEPECYQSVSREHLQAETPAPSPSTSAE